jgi:hypothetical protein
MFIYNAGALKTCFTLYHGLLNYTDTKAFVGFFLEVDLQENVYVQCNVCISLKTLCEEKVTL